jgi:CheY-like chemotaxis protein
MFLDPCEAVAALRSRSFIPELVIIDLTMPNLSGLECLNQLREVDYSSAVKFVLYSSAMPPKELLDCLATLGAVVFQKPSSIKELSAIISGLME